jgi:tight adherence protein B
LSQSLVTVIAISVLIAVGIGVVFVGLVFLVIRPVSVDERMTRYVDTTSGDLQKTPRPRDQLSQFRYQLNSVLSILTSEDLRIKLAAADWQMSATEYMFLRFCLAGAGFAIGWFIPKSIFGGLGLGILAYILPGFFLSRGIFMRQRKFQAQLVDVLVLIRGSVQAGYSLLQSLDVVINELPAPASEEFLRVRREVQFGLPLSEALLNLSSRMESDDLHLVVTAIIINSQVGGNLTTILTAVTETIRSRIFLFGEVRALTSYARYTATFLSLLPFIAGTAIYLLNPEYFADVWPSPIGRGIFIGAACSIVVGNIVLRRIARVDI